MTASPLRWAILGTGAIAARFAADMHHSRTGIVHAVASRTPERARAFAACLGPGVLAGAPDDILKRAEVDAVYVATPNAAHLAGALMALEAAKPVLVEKPFAATAQEARTLAEAADRAGLLTMEAMWMRFTPGIVRLKRLADEGALGRLARLDAALSFAHAIAPGSPLADPAGGGALLDLGVYPVSLALHLLGPAEAVSAQVRRSAGGAIVSVGLVTRHGEALGILACGFDAEGANEASLAGTKGVARAHRSMLCPPMISMRRTGPASPPPAADGAISIPPRPRIAALPALRALASEAKVRRHPTLFAGSGLHYQADHFAECLARGLRESPVMPLAQSIAVLDLIEEAARA